MAVASTGVSAEIPNQRRKVFFGLFVFPMLIAVTMAVLLSSIVLLTREDETPESLITAIKTGTPSKRWQKAFELSNELNAEGGLIRSEGIMSEVIHVLNDKTRYDAKTRSYMAMALSRFQNAEAEAALLDALSATDDLEDPSVPLFLMWGIGNLEHSGPAPEAARTVSRFLESEHGDLRKGAAYILGVLGDASVISQLKIALEDSIADVRWNAALSLARLGDDSGLEVLLEMVDRKHLHLAHQLSEAETETIMVNAVKGLGLINHPDALPIVEEISKTDQSLKVRQVALTALSQDNSSNG
jgi:HEAT repeat protein